MTTLSAAPALAVAGSSDCNLTSPASAPVGTDAQHARRSDAVASLTFSDTPSEVFQLRSFDDDRSKIARSTTPQTQLHPQQHLGTNDTSPITATTPSPQPIPIHPRKPSPGLAARLKALGFGNTRKSTSPPPS